AVTAPCCFEAASGWWPGQYPLIAPRLSRSEIRRTESDLTLGVGRIRYPDVALDGRGVASPEPSRRTGRAARMEGNSRPPTTPAQSPRRCDARRGTGGPARSVR